MARININSREFDEYVEDNKKSYQKFTKKKKIKIKDKDKGNETESSDIK